MKIHKIHIQNIASIGESEVDFECPELVTEPIFLITGQTGTGKTTLLNSICLALYDDVPSLKSIGSTEGGETNGLNVKNTRQFVRRGTAKGSIVMWYKGIDGKEYKISWISRRARGAVDGNWQQTERALECFTIDSEGNECPEYRHTKKADIEACVKLSVGLTFDQFTRTTLLAQGQFASFMKASDSEKADILEKLTGTDIYATIGRKVNELYKESEKKLTEVKARIDMVHLLDDTRRDELQTNIRTLTEQIEELKEKIEKTGIKINWLQRADELQKALNSKKEEETNADQALKTEDYNNNRQLLQDREATVDARQILKRLNELDKEDRELQLRQQQFEINGWPRVAAGMLWCVNDVAQREQGLKKIADELQQMEALSTMILNAQSIGQLANNAETASSEIKTETDKISKIDKKLKDRADEEKKLEEAVETANNQFHETEKEANELKQEAEKYNLQQVTAQRDEANAVVVKLQKAITALEKWANAFTENANAVKALDETNAEMERIGKSLEENNRLLPAAEAAFQLAKGHRDGEMEIKDHIASIRRRFAETDVCPVCGSTGVNLIIDEEIDAKLAEAEQKLEEADKALQVIKDKIAADDAALKVNQKNQKRQQKDCDQKLTQLTNAEKDIAECLKDTGLDFHAQNCGDELKKQLGEAEELLQKRNNVVKQANQLHTNLGAARVKLDKERAVCEKNRKALEDFREQTGKLQSEKETCLATKATHEKNRDNAVAQLSELLTVEYRQQMEEQGVAKIAKQISDLRSAWDDLTDQKQKAENELTLLRDLRDDCERKIRPLVERFGDIKENLQPRQLKNLEIEVEQLATQMVRLDENFTKNSEKRKEQNKNYGEALDKLQMSDERLKAVDAYTDEEIRLIKQRKEDLDGAAQRAHAARQEVERQITEHDGTRPEIAEGETLESLNVEKQECSALRDAKFEECSKQRQELEADAKASAEQATYVAERDRLQVRTNNWKVLDTSFGGADGSKFRKVAQSYVLGVLLGKANYYLAQLSPRYTLSCMPGSLTINVIDAYQGDSVRNVGSLSGGEGFVVSLALALGLASISKENIQVDTLFIDEGFGSLDQETLETVVTTLDRLHQMGGRRIGIISHIQELKSRIPVQICLERVNPGLSKCVVRVLS